MERRESDETLILNNVLWRDDSDRIGGITRNAQQYETQNHATTDQVRAIMATVNQTVNDTFQSLQNFLAGAMAQLEDVLAQGQAQARTASAELEDILSSAPPAVLQADLDALGTKVQTITTIAEEAVAEQEALQEEHND